MHLGGRKSAGRDPGCCGKPPGGLPPGRLPGHLRRRDRTGGFLDGGERPEPPGRAGGSSEGGDPGWGSLLPAFPALRQAASCDAAGENTRGLPGNPILIKSGVVAQVEGVEEWTRPVISLQVEEGGPCRSYHAAFMTSPDIVSGPAHPGIVRQHQFGPTGTTNGASSVGQVNVSSRAVPKLDRPEVQSSQKMSGKSSWNPRSDPIYS